MDRLTLDGRRKGALALGTLAAVPLASADAAEAMLPADPGGGAPVTQPSGQPEGQQGPATPPPPKPPTPAVEAAPSAPSVPLGGHPTTRRKPPSVPLGGHPTTRRSPVDGYADDRRRPRPEPPSPAPEADAPRYSGHPTNPARTRRPVEATEAKPPRLSGHPTNPPGAHAPAIGRQAEPPGPVATPYSGHPTNPVVEKYADDRREPVNEPVPEEEPPSEPAGDAAEDDGGFSFGVDVNLPGDHDFGVEVSAGGDDSELPEFLGDLQDQGAGFLDGAQESVEATKDGLVSSYESMGLDVCLPLPAPAQSPCTTVTPPGVSDEEHEEAVDERVRLFEFAIDHPGEFGKQAINWEDLKEGRYGEWLGGLAPDALLGAVTGGTGGIATRVLRVTGGKAPDADAPDVPGSRDGDDPGDSPGGGPSADPRVDNLLKRFPRLADTPENRAALAGILRDTRSGGETKGTPREGTYIPTRTAGHVSELRTLAALDSRAGVSQIEVLPSSSNDRSPDFVVTMEDGSKTRVEVVTLTGRGANYQKRNQGRVAGPPTAGALRAAVMNKAKSTPDRPSQLDVPITGVPAGGTIAVHMRGGAGAADDIRRSVRTAMARARLKGSPHVREVEFFLPDRTVVRYVRQRDGSYTPAAT